MKKHLLAILAAVASLMAFQSCSSRDSDNDTPDPSGQRRSVIIYLSAQNSLGEAGAARLDSAEIAQGAMSLNSQDNVFLYMDDARLPRLYRMYRYKGRTIVDKVKAWPSDLCSSDPATLKEVLSFVASSYPSQSYGLVLWSHGDGWLESTSVVNTLKSSLYSFGIDVGTGGNLATDRDASGKVGPQMNIRDIARAISLSGIHMDYIFFDACLMQCIEVAYELKDVTDYLVASATSTSAYGGYYSNLLPKALMAYPATDQNISLIASQYYYDAVNNPSLRKYYGETGNVISVIKTAGLEDLAAATASCIAAAFGGKKSYNLSGTQAYSSSSYFDVPDYYDMGCVMHKVLPASQYEAWRAVANKCILTHFASERYMIGTVGNKKIYGALSDPANTVGVSMYVPEAMFSGITRHNYNADFKLTSWYTAAGWDTTGW